MTIQELYIFACKNDLLDKEVYTVINKFNTSSNTTTIIIDDSNDLPFKLDIIEYSYEDVLNLFS